MSLLIRRCLMLVLACGSAQALADASAHAAAAERVLKLARADKLTVPVYAQVQQLFAQRFAESKAPASKQPLLERYQAKANAALDRAIGWEALKGDLVALYTRQFDEQEMAELLAFYQSPVGRKLLESMPALTAQSAQLTQDKLAAAVPQVNQLLDQMVAELAAQQP